MLKYIQVFNKNIPIPEYLPWLKEPLAVAALVPLVLDIRSAVTVTGAADFKMLILMLSGTPGRKLLGVKTTYELK